MKHSGVHIGEIRITKVKIEREIPEMFFLYITV